MILARYTFQTKWGKSGEVVKAFQENLEALRKVWGENTKGRILTDLSGPFHTVVQEIEVESLAEWERIRAAMFESPEMQESQENFENPFESGSVEFFTVEFTF